MVQLTRSCSNAHTARLHSSQQSFHEVQKSALGNLQDSFFLGVCLVNFLTYHSCISLSFYHLGFPCITRHMFVTLLHNPFLSYTQTSPLLHAFQLCCWETAGYIKLSLQPSFFPHHPSCQQIPVMFTWPGLMVPKSLLKSV